MYVSTYVCLKGGADRQGEREGSGHQPSRTARAQLHAAGVASLAGLCWASRGHGHGHRTADLPARSELHGAVVRSIGQPASATPPPSPPPHAFLPGCVHVRPPRKRIGGALARRRGCCMQRAATKRALGRHSSLHGPMHEKTRNNAGGSPVAAGSQWLLVIAAAVPQVGGARRPRSLAGGLLLLPGRAASPPRQTG